MANQVDGVKLSVKDETPQAATPKKVTRKRVVKKKIAKPRAESADATDSIETKEDPAKRAATSMIKRPSGGKGNSLVNFLVVVITAVIVGGAIYTWQNNTQEQKLTEVEKESSSLKENFEKEVTRLKSKLLGTEEEKSKLEEEKQILEEKAKLLAEAKLIYKNEELGISFDYPAQFGEAFTSQVAGTSGAKYIGSFKDMGNLSFSYLTADYTASGTEDFLSSFGFDESDNKYYYLGLNDEELGVEPIKILNQADKEMLVLDRVSFSEALEDYSEGEDYSGSILSENELGVLINLKSDSYPAFIIIAKDKATFDLDSLINILETIK